MRKKTWLGVHKRASGPALLRKLDTQKTRDLLFRLFKAKPADVYMYTQNRESRRNFSRMQRRHGRGYTTPLKGPSHTRGG